jgi:hypothetical protein
MTRFELALELMKADAKSADKRMKRIWRQSAPDLEVPKPHPAAPTPYMPATCALYAPFDNAYNPGMRFADNYMGADF